MKPGKTCPKCGGTHILRVEDGGATTGVSLYLSFFAWVPVARYVCTDCGYVESWVDEKHLPDLKKRYERDNRK